MANVLSAKRKTPTGDRPFDPWWRAHSDSLRAFIALQAEDVETLAIRANPKRRRRQERHRGGYKRRVEAVLVDIIRYVLSGGPSGITVSRSSAHLTGPRYRHEIVETKDLLGVLRDLEAAGLVVSVRGTGKPKRFLPMDQRGDAPDEDRATVTMPGPALLEAIRLNEWTVREDLKRDHGDEVLVLMRKKPHPRAKGVRIDYAETEETKRLRAQVEAINMWIATFDLTIDGGPPEGAHYDTNARRLRRQFSHGKALSNGTQTDPTVLQRWDRGGRIWGGFWEGMKTSDRVRLRINGRRIAVADYGQLFGRMLYAMAGEEAPEGDLYGLQGLEGHRKGVKALLNSLLFHKGELKAWPEGVREVFPREIKLGQIVSMMKTAHAPIASFFGTGVGHHLLYRESQLMMAILEACEAADLPALPLHDAIMVPEDRGAEAHIIMCNEFARAFGSPGVVDVKWPANPGATLDLLPSLSPV